MFLVCWSWIYLQKISKRRILLWNLVSGLFEWCEDTLYYSSLTEFLYNDSCSFRRRRNKKAISSISMFQLLNLFKSTTVSVTGNAEEKDTIFTYCDCRISGLGQWVLCLLKNDGPETMVLKRLVNTISSGSFIYWVGCRWNVPPIKRRWDIQYFGQAISNEYFGAHFRCWQPENSFAVKPRYDFG